MTNIKLFEQWLSEAEEDSGKSKKFCGGLELYTSSNTPEGGTTPTGQSNVYDNNMFGLTEDELCKFAKDNGLPTTDNTTFQAALFDWLVNNGHTAVLSKMWSIYGNTAKGGTGKMDKEAFADGHLGARTFFVVKHTPLYKASPKEAMVPLYDDGESLFALGFRRSAIVTGAEGKQVSQGVDPFMQDIKIQFIKKGMPIPGNAKSNTPGIFTGVVYNIPWFVWNSQHDTTTKVTKDQLKNWECYKITLPESAFNGAPIPDKNVFGQPTPKVSLKRDAAIDLNQYFETH